MAKFNYDRKYVYPFLVSDRQTPFCCPAYCIGCIMYRTSAKMVHDYTIARYLDLKLPCRYDNTILFNKLKIPYKFTNNSYYEGCNIKDLNKQLFDKEGFDMYEETYIHYTHFDKIEYFKDFILEKFYFNSLDIMIPLLWDVNGREVCSDPKIEKTSRHMTLIEGIEIRDDNTLYIKLLIPSGGNFPTFSCYVSIDDLFKSFCLVENGFSVIEYKCKDVYYNNKFDIVSYFGENHLSGQMEFCEMKITDTIQQKDRDLILSIMDRRIQT